MKITIILLIIFLSGCASANKFISLQQDLKETEADKLCSLLIQPVENFKKIREIAFNNNPDVQLKAQSILLYRSELASFKELVSVFKDKNPGASVSNIASFISECFRKIRPHNDNQFQVRILDFGKTKLRIAQELSKSLSEYQTAKYEAEKLAREKAIGDVMNNFLKKYGFAVEKKKENKKLTESVEKKEKLEREIYELCGLIKIGETK